MGLFGKLARKKTTTKTKKESSAQRAHREEMRAQREAYDAMAARIAAEARALYARKDACLRCNDAFDALESDESEDDTSDEESDEDEDVDVDSDDVSSEEDDTSDEDAYDSDDDGGGRRLKKKTAKDDDDDDDDAASEDDADEPERDDTRRAFAAAMTLVDVYRAEPIWCFPPPKRAKKEERDAIYVVESGEVDVEVERKARSIHWSPYDRVGVVNADP